MIVWTLWVLAEQQAQILMYAQLYHYGTICFFSWFMLKVSGDAVKFNKSQELKIQAQIPVIQFEILHVEGWSQTCKNFLKNIF